MPVYDPLEHGMKIPIAKEGITVDVRDFSTRRFHSSIDYDERARHRTDWMGNTVVPAVLDCACLNDIGRRLLRSVHDSGLFST